ncbi:CGNR zinc finger protein [Stackebrandtia albiflava]|uniref:CGNR zinc finger protein n=1 Tax=Stackebrandtia albiflava TaxID=406432 RepID=A0A562V239_9ACTN|nr:CGNR zinc finger domain-containing protein [Stackebrandtia albiflava]TWJ11944.1 CGNR zinc finger protein [Stackebrandtia albiflava]
MHLNPYGKDAVVLAVGLVNDPPADVAGLVDRCTGAGLVLERTATGGDLAAVRDFLADWCEVVDTSEAAARARLLNRLLAEYAAAPRLTDHVGTGWHLHFRSEDLPVRGQLAALISVGTALHLAGRGMDRLGRCAAEGCDRVFADVSRNGRQRYCSPACGNRDAVRRHRARTRAETG